MSCRTQASRRGSTFHCCHAHSELGIPRVHEDVCTKGSGLQFCWQLTLAAQQATHVIQGYFAMTYSALLRLSLHDEKTFVWELTTSLRKTLAQLGFPCVFDANELGASMTYGVKIRNRLFKGRGLGMEDKWQRLQRSMAPFSQKITMLPKVCWPKALHGSPACVFSDGHLLKLRRMVTKALQVGGAGSNPLLCLNLSDDLMNDPGFYQLEHCVSTLRRLAQITWSGAFVEAAEAHISWQIFTWAVHQDDDMPESDWMECTGTATCMRPWTTHLEFADDRWQNHEPFFGWCVAAVGCFDYKPPNYAGFAWH